MATMPADPGGSAAPILSSRPLSTRCLANLPTRAPAAPPTPTDASSGGANRPTTWPAPPPISRPLRPRWSPVSLMVTLPSASLVTSATPSTVSCLSVTSLTRASKSWWARSGIRYAAMTTSNSVSLIAVPPWAYGLVLVLGVDAAGGVCLMGVRVQGILVLAVGVRGYVEDHLLDCAGERERRLGGVAAVDDQAVVPADVQARIAAEA